VGQITGPKGLVRISQCLGTVVGINWHEGAREPLQKCTSTRSLWDLPAVGVEVLPPVCEIGKEICVKQSCSTIVHLC